jgi:PKD repeat protein
MVKSFYASLLAVCLFGTAVSAQTSTPTSRVKFQSGTYALPELTEDTYQQRTAGERGSDYVLRVLGVEQIWTESQRSALEQAGLDILGYLPHKSYLAYFNLKDSHLKGLLEANGLAFISPLLPEMKLTSLLHTGNVPDYVWAGSQWEVYVECYPASSQASVQSHLARVGQILEASPIGFRVLVAPDQVRALASHPNITLVQQKEAPAEPENRIGTKNHRSSALRVPYAGGRDYDGTGVVVGHGDDGDIEVHIDFKGRIAANKSSPSFGAHGDHVAGTIFGAGNLDPDGEGQAPGAHLVYYDYPDNLNDVDADYSTYDVRITASSYSNGCNAGYTAFTRQMDEDAIQNYSLTHVFSAGNNGTANCNYGAGSGWGNITGGHKQGKNVIATANVTGADLIANSSSRGPAHDGRIKPDIAALGTDVYSCLSPNDYRSITGTSMACPGIAGVMAQLYDAYMQNNGGAEPAGGLMRALLTNNADDLGNPGPDFKYGYGRANGLRAAKAIENGWFMADTISQNQTDTISIVVPAGLGELRVMLHWTDPQALVNAGTALVNNLNATLVLDAQSWNPWVLNPTPTATALNANAQRAVDSLNTSEQFTLANPSGGTYKVLVNGASIPSGPQTYWVTWTFVEQDIELTYPVGGEILVAGQSTPVRWDAPDGTGTFTLEYSNNGGAWTTFATAAANARQSAFTPPAGAGDSLMIRISRGTQADSVDFRLGYVGVPSNLNMDWACPDSFRVSWNMVPGASGYVVYLLGAEYMDPIDTVTTPWYVYQNINPFLTQWWTVSAITSGQRAGKRAYAEEKTPGLAGCPMANDAVLAAVLSPSGQIPDCQNTSALPVNVTLTNGGSDTLFSVPLAYQLGSGAVQRDTLVATIPATQSMPFSFSASLNISGLGNYGLKVWTELSADQNPYNDTLVSNFQIVVSDSTYTLPYVQNFDSFTNCGTVNNCGGTVCLLGDHMVNAANGIDDDHDWRTNATSTPSAGTGPTGGHTLGGGSSDKYLYLESSTCTESVALVTTPCIDLTAASLPELKFWYHMLGGDQGELHVDVLSQGQWHLDVIQPISGNQGSSWLEASASMTPYVGNIIVVRFRGITGTGIQSDIAIDDISVVEVNTAPSAALAVSSTGPCLNQVVTFYDQSTSSPNAWAWSLTPATGFSFVNGTSASSQNPQVVFTSFGSFTVQLIASNTFGSDTAVSSSTIVVNGGAPLPFSEDFSTWLPTSWEIENPDNSTTWAGRVVIGSAGTATQTAYMDNFAYNAPLQEDYLITPGIDLTGTTVPALVFDVAYTQYSASYSDGLRVDVSNSCGSSWMPTGYNKSGTVLATTGNLTTSFTPQSSGVWRSDTIYLDTALAGPSIKFRFAGLNGYGNNLYIDNVQVFDFGATAPTAVMNSSASASTCKFDTVIFQAINPGNAIATWNFGLGATPPTATGPGPHAVTYFTSGSKTAVLSLTNAGGTGTASTTFTVGTPVVAVFGANAGSTPQERVFIDISQGGPTQWYWNFGDGTTSTVQNPTHTFPAAGGTYTITFAAYNTCGWDTTTSSITISGVSLEERSAPTWALSPNPAQNYVKLSSPNGAKADRVEVLDALGRVVYRGPMPAEQRLDVQSYSAGRYLVRIWSGGQSKVLPFVKQ